MLGKLPTQLNKRSVTLLEVLFVMLLLGLISGTIAFPIRKALRGEKFERGVDQIISKMTLAQELMLNFNADVHLALRQKGEEIECLLTVERPLPLKLEREINRHTSIKGIAQMNEDGVPKEAVDLFFSSEFKETPKKELTFQSENKDARILLKGYPYAIKRSKNEETITCYVPYPEEILSSL
jgi:hypothetical protein